MNNSNSSNNDKLFFSIWRNIYLNNQIFEYLHLLSPLFDKYKVVTISQEQNEKFKQFNYKQYIQHIKFDQVRKDILTNKEYISEMINLKKIEIKRSLKDYSPSVIPYGVECICFPIGNYIKADQTIINSELPISVTRIENANFNTHFKFNSINVSKNIKSIKFHLFNETLSNDTNTNATCIPSTITDITFDRLYKNGGLRLKSTDFHSGITKLDLGGYIVKNEEKYSIFPKSLTNLTFKHDSDLIIDNETIPKSVISLNILSAENYDTGNYKKYISKGLTILNGSIPNSLTSLTINAHDMVIDSMALVNSNITELVISKSLISPNEITTGFLPSKLKSFKYYMMVGCNNKQISPTLIKKGSLPNSLEKFEYKLNYSQYDNTYISNNTTDFQYQDNHFSNNINLTDLKLSCGFTFNLWPANCLPNTIKSLQIIDCENVRNLEAGGHKLSLENLPSSIKTINISHFSGDGDKKYNIISPCILSSPNIKICVPDNMSETFINL